ncbi:MAG TPA: L,D-transpeptidase family protein [Thermotogota bacterium]|nr:L,D-transpeptidase family protein [Thermotogota bacterium]
MTFRSWLLLFTLLVPGILLLSRAPIVFPEKREDQLFLTLVWEEPPTLQPPLECVLVSEAREVPFPLFSQNGRLLGQLPYDPSHFQGSETSLRFTTASQILSFPLLEIQGYLFLPDEFSVPLHSSVQRTIIVQPGDYFFKIARENQSSVGAIQLLNPEVHDVHPGQVLHIGKVWFPDSPFLLLIHPSQCKLELWYGDAHLRTFPIATGRDGSTPSGEFFLQRKIPQPALYWEGEFIQPLSPINGLGSWWLELSDPQYGIHGTNKPWEIGKQVSHGCIRMFNHDVSLLAKLLPVGTRVKILPE